MSALHTTLDVTPSWWPAGREHYFKDAVDVLRAIDATRAEILAFVFTVRLDATRVSFVFDLPDAWLVKHPEREDGIRWMTDQGETIRAALERLGDDHPRRRSQGSRPSMPVRHGGEMTFQ